MIKKFNKNTKTYRLFSALQAGEKLTQAEANKR